MILLDTFILRDLYPMSFFKLVMIVLLKIYAAGKIFGKLCLKAIRNTFFSNMWSVISRGKGDWEWYPTDGESSNFYSCRGTPSPNSPPLVWHLNLSIRKVLKSAWSAYCNGFDKSEWEYFLSKQQIYSM